MSYDEDHEQVIQKPSFEIGNNASPVRPTTFPNINILSLTSDDSLTNREIAELTSKSYNQYSSPNLNNTNSHDRIFRARANSLSSTYEEHSKRFRNTIGSATFASKYNQLWKQPSKVASLSSFASKCEDLIPSTINRNFWNRFTMSKSCSNLHDTNLIQSTGSDINESKSNDNNNNDYIPSPTLFDHIETFSFDDVLTDSSSKASSPASSVKKISGTNNNSNKQKLNSRSSSSNSAQKTKQQTLADLEQFSNEINHKISIHLENTKTQRSPPKSKPIISSRMKEVEKKKLELNQPHSKVRPMRKKKTLHERRLENNLVNRSMLGGDMYVSVTRKPVVKRPKVKQRKGYYEDEVYPFHEETVENFRDNNLNSSGNESMSSSGNDSLSVSETDSINFSRNDSFGSSSKDSLQTSEPTTPDLIDNSITYTNEIHGFRPIPRCELTYNV